MRRALNPTISQTDDRELDCLLWDSIGCDVTAIGMVLRPGRPASASFRQQRAASFTGR